MTDEGERLSQDVAFLRSLVDGSVSIGLREGAVLTAIGVFFGLVALQYWAIDTGIASIPASWRSWLWLDGLAPFLAALAGIESRLGGAKGPAARAVSGAWAGVGVSLVFSTLGLVAAGWRLGQPLLPAQVFPIVLFGLFAAGWSVVFTVRRRVSLVLPAGGSAVAAIATGLLAGKPAEWLALAAGLLLVAALPGGLIVLSQLKRRIA
jgi:hypothetical protein